MKRESDVKSYVSPCVSSIEIGTSTFIADSKGTEGWKEETGKGSWQVVGKDNGEE